MATQIATLIMLLYAVGSGFLSRVLHKHLPPISQQYVARWMRPWIAIFWMWGPTFWFIPGLVWFRILGVPHELRLTLIGLSFFLPLLIFVIFTSLLGLFPFKAENPYDMLMTYLAVGFVVLLTLIFLGLSYISPGLNTWKFIFYSVIIALHPCISVLTLVYTAPKVIPCPSSRSLAQLKSSLSMLTSFFTSSPKSAWTIQNGQTVTRIPGNPVHGSGHGWLLTEPENVVMLGNGYLLTRIEEPGVVIPQDAESPYRVVDLRNQRRSMDVTALTRDGIEVNVPFSFSFRIDSGPKRPELLSPWPIHRRDIYQTVFAEVVDPDGKTPLDEHRTHPWEDLPLKIAVYKIKQAVGFYSLFQLYEMGTSPQLRVIHKRAAEALEVDFSDEMEQGLTRVVIGNLVLASVHQMLKPHGFHIYAGGIDKSIVPLSKELTRQRVEAWKTQWISKVMHWQAESHTNPRQDMFAAGEPIFENLETVIEELYLATRSTDAPASKTAVADTLLEHLMNLAHTPDVEPLLPESVLPALMRLKEAQGKS